MAFDSDDIFKASCAALRSESTRAMPSGVAGSVSWVMNMRADLPSGDRNIFRPRSKSGFWKASGGRKNRSSFFAWSKLCPIARAVSLVASIWSSRAFCELYDASDRSLLVFIDAIVCGSSAVSCGARSASWSVLTCTAPVLSVTSSIPSRASKTDRAAAHMGMSKQCGSQ